MRGWGLMGGIHNAPPQEKSSPSFSLRFLSFSAVFSLYFPTKPNLRALEWVLLEDLKGT